MSNELDLTKFKKCNCGATIESENVKVKHDYTLMGWFWWTMGTTAIPKEITFRCKSCDQVFERLTDKEMIKYYIFYRKY